jgi:NodT family efflux transporter outer membrane factor (OMF) lipoprotein
VSAPDPIAPSSFAGRPRRAGGVLAALLLAGCAVGPDFVKPAPPAVPAYTSSAMPEQLTPGSGEADQRIANGQTIAAGWWQLFHSPPLDAVLSEAIAGNQTLAAANATLAQAQEALNQARAAFYPQIDLALSARRDQTTSLRSTSGRSGGGGGGSTSVSNLYNLGPSVSYTPDVFGATRRKVEQEQALAQSQAYQLAAAYLTLTGNAVSQAINIASARLQIKATEDIIAEDEQNLALVRAKFQAGKAARTDVLIAESQLANDRTLLPPLSQQLSVARHALAVLSGKFPQQSGALNFDLAAFTLPGELPLSLPSQLVRQRPDILSAEANLHAASAAVGVATAQLYPTVTLSASFGYESTDLGALFQGSSEIWSLVSGLSAPIFHGGALQAQRRGAIDAFQSSLATYQQTVLQAFGQVADTLRALANDADLVGAGRRALDVANASLALQRLSYTAGKSDLIQLLDSQRLYQQALLGYARDQAQRFQDTTQLFVAMGGGWWASKELAIAHGPGDLPALTPTG